MVRLWKKISVRSRIIITSLFLLTLFSISFFTYYSTAFRDYVMENRRNYLKDMVGIVVSTCDSYKFESEMGRFPIEDAKSSAIYHINKYRYGVEGSDSFFMLYPDGMGVSLPYREDLVGKNLLDIADPEGTKYYAEMVKIAREKGSGFLTYRSQYKSEVTRIVPILTYVSFYEPFNIIIGTGLYIEDIRHEINLLYLKIFLTLLIVSALAVPLLLWLSGSISRPIRELVSGMADGDLNTKLHSDYEDEIGLLAEEFNRFIEKIRNVFLGTKDATHLLAASAEELSSISVSFAERAVEQSTHAEKIRNTIGDISREMNSVTNDIDSEFEKLNSLITKMETLSNIITGLNRESQQALDRIEQIRGDARGGEKSLNGMLESINNIADRSQELFGILDLINGISEQINLLSLNAAIEAARAGDYGRGFAVVADEISKLADKTSQSLKVIGSIIRDNESELKTGIDRVRETVRVIGSIITGINSIGEMIKGVALQARDQLGTNQQVETEIREIKNMSEGIRMTTKVQMLSVNEIHDMVKVITETSTSITASSEELASNSEEVSGMAENLKGMIEGYKI